MEISAIKINYQIEPIGIEKIENISWELVSSDRNVFQKAYELQISENEDFSEILFDSKKVLSEESAHIKIDESILKLKSCQKYFIRVRTESSDGKKSDWKNSSFVTALVSLDELMANFISIESENDNNDSKGSHLRKEIVMNKEIKSAYALSSALGIYYLFINGKKVGIDELTPGWTSYNKHLLYQIYDVKDYLQTGKNVIGGMVGAGWYKGKMGFLGFKNHYGKRTAFICQLAVEYTDGTKEIFVTDNTWTGAFGPIIFSEIYDGEIYDANLEIKNWCETSCEYNSWNKTELVDFDKSVLKAQSGSKIRKITEIKPKKIFKTPEGDTVIDFGQNMTGWIEFNARGKKGDCVEFSCFEILDANGNVYLDNLRSAKQKIKYIFNDSGEDVIYHPYFTFQGFQYAKIISYPEEPKKEMFTAFAVHSDMEVTGEFECSNPDINQLQHNILWGMKGNFLDVPTDCPQRDERLGWTGDAQIFCRTAAFNMDIYTFFSKWLRDLKEDQTAEGGVPHVVPDILIGKSEKDRLMQDGEHSAAAWADAAVICPWTLYLVYGDKDIIYKQYDSMKAWIDFMQKHSNNNIWNYKLQFGDWVALDAEEGSYFGATPNDLTCTAFYAYSTGLFAKMAEIIGNLEDAKKYKKLYTEIVETYQKTFFKEDGHLNVQTQTAQILTLYFDLVKAENRAKVAEDLIKLLEKENNHLVTGFVGTPYFCHALSQNGYIKEAYDLLLKDDFPSWLYQIRQGATTVWEHWDGLRPDGTMWSPDMNSFNHYAYGAVGDWMYRVIAGIDCSEKEVGYKHSIISPRLGGGFDFVKSSFKSVYGRIVSEWKVGGNKAEILIEIPCNTKSTIRIPDAKKIIDADGLKFEEENGVLSAETGSGIYKIKFEM